MRRLALLLVLLLPVLTIYSQKENYLPKKGVSVDYSVYLIPQGESNDDINFKINVQVNESSKQLTEYEIKFLEIHIEDLNVNFYKDDLTTIRNADEVLFLKNLRFIIRSRGNETPTVKLEGIPEGYRNEMTQAMQLFGGNDLFLQLDSNLETLELGQKWAQEEDIMLDGDSVHVSQNIEVIELEKEQPILKKKAQLHKIRAGKLTNPLSVYQYSSFHKQDHLMDWQMSLIGEKSIEEDSFDDMIGFIIVRSGDVVAQKKVKALRHLLANDWKLVNEPLGNWDITPTSEPVPFETPDPNFKDWYFKNNYGSTLKELKQKLGKSFYHKSYNQEVTEIGIEFPAFQSEQVNLGFLEFKDVKVKVELENGQIHYPKLEHSEQLQDLIEMTDYSSAFFFMEDLLEEIEFPKGVLFSSIKGITVLCNLEKPSKLNHTAITAADIGKRIPTKRGYVKLLRLENDFAEYEAKGSMSLIAVNADSELLDLQDMAYKHIELEGSQEGELISHVMELVLKGDAMYPEYRVKLKTSGKIDRLLYTDVISTDIQTLEFKVQPFPDFSDTTVSVPEVLNNESLVISSDPEPKTEYRSVTTQELKNTLSVDTVIHEKYYPVSSSFHLKFPKAKNQRFAEVKLLEGISTNNEPVELIIYDYEWMENNWDLHFETSVEDYSDLLSIGWSGKLQVTYPKDVLLKRSSIIELPEHIKLIGEKAIEVSCSVCFDDVLVFNDKGQQLQQVASPKVPTPEVQPVPEEGADEVRVVYYWGEIAEVQYPKPENWETVTLELDYEPVGDPIPIIEITEPLESFEEN